ncbi:MAG: GNAT family N-acetyltransferase [Candidatus Hodarchaeota archaeon]
MIDSDIPIVRDIYNYYVINGVAAYSEKEVDLDFFLKMKKEALSFYILEINNEIVGFCVLRNYLPYENFRHTGLLTYFIKFKLTNKGYGSILYEKLIEDAKRYGIKTLIVHLSSLNSLSINFHKKHGFKECGRFKNIAKKFNQDFDIIWMQKFI